MSFLETLRLRNFRSYSEASLTGLASNFVILTGSNGAGKTNILEALSYLTPGRGLRQAHLNDLQNRELRVPWGIHAVVEAGFGPVDIHMNPDPVKSKRIIKIQGEQVKSQSILADYLSCLWLTPQMDRLFIDASSARRRFLDRMVFAFDPGHAGRITRYDHALSQRAHVLQDTQLPSPSFPSPSAPSSFSTATLSWLDSLESQMAQSAVAITAARLDFIDRLQKVCARRPSTHFPIARLAVSGEVEDLLLTHSAVKTEQIFKEKLAHFRTQDAAKGGAHVGPHRSDFLVSYEAKSMPAHECSTGEQKALLIALILAHADLIRAERGSAPILLLDEVAAHLDPTRRAALYDMLEHLKAQVWMTGTEREIFKELDHRAQFFSVDHSQITPSTNL